MADITPATLRPNILANIDKFVKAEIDAGEIPKDAKIAMVGIIDGDGLKIAAVVELSPDPEKYKLKFKAIFEHDWDGNDGIAAKVIFSR